MVHYWISPSPNFGIYHSHFRFQVEFLLQCRISICIKEKNPGISRNICYYMDKIPGSWALNHPEIKKSRHWNFQKISVIKNWTNPGILASLLKSKSHFDSFTRKPSYSSFFSAWCTDFKSIIFEKIHPASSEEANFWISSSFCKLSFRIFVVLGFEVIWPRRPQTSEKSEKLQGVS